MEKPIMPEVKVIDFASLREHAGAFLSKLVHFLPETPLAPHGDTLPTALRVEPDVRAEASDY